MADLTQDGEANPYWQAVPDSLEQLDALLGQLNENIGDPATLGVIIQNLASLVEGGLSDLAERGTEPEAKAKVAHLAMQITELEQILQNRQSILAGFSVYLKGLVEG